MAKAYDYEPCEACKDRRWKGLSHPLCKDCWSLIETHLPIFAATWKITQDKVMGLDVSIPLKASIVALAKELRRPQTQARLTHLSQPRQ